MARPVHKESPASPRRINQLRGALLRWYDTQQRDLPWRRTHDAYAIWVSEIMLQQTRVDVVVPYFERFLQRFPDIPQLAAAPLEDLLQMWAGLGYYSRARNLHRAAQHIVETHGGHFPQEPAAILALPGVGRYTAGAIGSIAFEQRLPIVDGNVMRVMSRFFALTECIDTTAAKTSFWDWASLWADCQRPGDANQALMELGATLCQRSSPDCGRCPAARWCEAHQQHIENDIPIRAKRRASEHVELAALLLRRRGRLLLVRRQHGRLLQDFWEMPTVRLTTTNAGKSHLGAAQFKKPLSRYMGIEVDSWKRLGEARHSILHHRIQVQVMEGLGSTSIGKQRAASKRPLEQVGRTAASALENILDAVEVRWMTAHQCRDLAMTTLARKALHAAARQDSSLEQYASHRPAQKPTGKRRDEPAGNHS